MTLPKLKSFRKSWPNVGSIKNKVSEVLNNLKFIKNIQKYYNISISPPSDILEKNIFTEILR